MTRLTGSVTTERSIEEVFAFIADFSHIAAWDPGVSASEQVAGDGLEVGAQYQVMASFVGRPIPMRYRVTAMEPLRRVVLVGEADGSLAVDHIQFTDTGNGTRVDYIADITLVGVSRIFTPLAAPFLHLLAHTSMKGMRRRFAQKGALPGDRRRWQAKTGSDATV